MSWLERGESRPSKSERYTCRALTTTSNTDLVVLSQRGNFALSSRKTTVGHGCPTTPRSLGTEKEGQTILFKTVTGSPNLIRRVVPRLSLTVTLHTLSTFVPEMSSFPGSKWLLTDVLHPPRFTFFQGNLILKSLSYRPLNSRPDFSLRGPRPFSTVRSLYSTLLKSLHHDSQHLIWRSIRNPLRSFFNITKNLQWPNILTQRIFFWNGTPTDMRLSGLRILSM